MESKDWAQDCQVQIHSCCSKQPCIAGIVVVSPCSGSSAMWLHVEQKEQFGQETRKLNLCPHTLQTGEYLFSVTNIKKIALPQRYLSVLCYQLKNSSVIVLLLIVSKGHPLYQERIRTGTRVRACNYIKIETMQNFLPVLKIVTHTAQAAYKC